ncbi:MAG: hypothetical protein JXA30_14640 [Deltaproteobacteria bacterium]|nr:hypothetical protein [Deltaproteobacteria bacterium]
MRAFLSRATREPDLAYDLMLAYESLEAAARRIFVGTIIAEAQAEKISPSAVLAALLAVERDPGLARLIASNITVDGGTGLDASIRPYAMLAGDEVRGGALTVRPLFADFIEIHALVWNGEEGVTHVLFDPLADSSRVTQFLECLPGDLCFDQAPVDLALDRVAKILWTQRKRFGPLPAELRSFAELFGD